MTAQTAQPASARPTLFRGINPTVLRLEIRRLVRNRDWRASAGVRCRASGFERFVSWPHFLKSNKAITPAPTPHAHSGTD